MSDVRQRYAGLAGGLLWMGLSPFLLMSLYAVVYVAIFQIRPVSLTRLEYVVYIFSGLIPLFGFVEALNAGTGSLAANRAVLLNTVFPAELVPIRAVIVSHVTTVFGLAILVAATVVLRKAALTLLLVPLCLLLQVMFVAGITWLLSLGNLVLRDIQQFLTYATLILLMVSPVAYTPDMVPRRLAVIIYLNPLSYFVVTFQNLILFGRLPSAEVALACVALGIGSFCVGFSIFSRIKQVFFDYA
jgi:lipopolysaccharide transport system permease protein